MTVGELKKELHRYPEDAVVAFIRPDEIHNISDGDFIYSPEDGLLLMAVEVD